MDSTNEIYNPQEQAREEEAEIMRRLNEAATIGDVNSLTQVLEARPLILDRIIADGSVSETPLHISALRGHLNVVKALLDRKPELSRERDYKGSSPLHLASARGHVEIVQEMVKMDRDLCLVRDEAGRTALHVAAMKGQIDVLQELIRNKPEASGVVTEEGETIYHVAVRYNCVDVLKLLMDQVLDNDDEVKKKKDNQGNTVLHVAAYKKRIECIKYLLRDTSRIEINALNQNGFTALDVLIQGPRDLKDMEISEILRDSGAVRAKDINSAASVPVPSNPSTITLDHQRTTTQQLSSTSASAAAAATVATTTTTSGGSRSCVCERWKTATNKLNDKLLGQMDKISNALMVVASLIATVTFQAVLSPPGGFFQEDSTTHSAGISVFRVKHPSKYSIFICYNTVGFASSVCAIVWLIVGSVFSKTHFLRITIMLMFIAVGAMSVTYATMLNIKSSPPWGVSLLFVSIVVSSWMVAFTPVITFLLSKLLLRMNSLQIRSATVTDCMPSRLLIMIRRRISGTNRRRDTGSSDFVPRTSTGGFV